MTETPDFEQVEDVNPADFDDAFDARIGGASLTKRSVIVYAKPGLAAEADALQRELATLSDVEIEESMAGDPRQAEITERLGEIYDEWMASKSE